MKNKIKIVLGVLVTAWFIIWGIGIFLPSQTNQKSEYFSTVDDKGLGTQVTAENINDRIAITTLINAWGNFRDRGKWQDLKNTFWPDGKISLSWFDGPFEAFVGASKKIAEGGNSMTHLLQTPYVVIKGERAIAETNATLKVRAPLKFYEVDITSQIRFYDFLEKRNGEWKISKRVGIYENDRMDPVSPSSLFYLNSFFVDARSKLNKTPPSSKYLAYLLSKKGLKLKENIVEDKTAEMEALYQEGRAWINETSF